MKMSSLRFALFVCTIVSCGCLLGQPTQEPSKTPQINEGTQRHVSGYVIDDLTGQPISGAKVQLSVVVMHGHGRCLGCSIPPKPPEQPPPLREIMSGEDGGFKFDNVPPRQIYVTASKDGYLTSWPIRRRANDTLGHEETLDKSIDSFVIRLAPEATISGVLRHHDGSPVTLQPQIALMHVRTWAGFPRVEYGGWPKYQGDGSYSSGRLYPGCYYLIATPFRKKDFVRFEGGRAFGETPVRYPVLSEPKSNSCFTLREGEHLTVDLTLPEKELHRVTATSSPVTILSVNIRDEGGGYYSFHELYPENKSEAWLPDGRYWLDNGRDGEISGPIPFTVNNADLNDLHFMIEEQNSTWMKVPVDITISSQESPTDAEKVGRCGFVDAYLVRFDRNGYVEVGDNLGFTLGEHCGVQKPVAASMTPGTYTLVVDTTWLNYYVKSIRSGDFDLSEGPLDVRPRVIPKPLKIELAYGGRIKGSVQFEGKPAKAWVYTLVLGTSGKADFRLFNPAFTREDGKFEVMGLAPGAYFVFASDVELELDKAHLTANAFWITHGKKIDVVAGKTNEIELTAFDPPDEP
jgi:hypothetical protein